MSDAAAVFVEPLAAACRIVEQNLAPPDAEAAVLGDGKLGLLISEVLARRGSVTWSTSVKNEDLTVSQKRGGTTLIGRHKEKMDLCCKGNDGSKAVGVRCRFF